MTKTNNPKNNSEVAPKENSAINGWIAQRMAELADRSDDKISFLLAHADDGVIWGKYANGQFLTSHDVTQNSDSASISPELRGITLQHAWLFNPACELRLFRDELGKWQSHTIDSDSEKCIDELQVLWGNREAASFKDGFTHIYEHNQQGLDQIVPIKITQAELIQGMRVRLCVRHYIAFDDEQDENDISRQGTGEARIAFSRLVNVEKSHA